MARSPLTETIYKVQGMITYVRENLSTDEFMLFLDLLVPEPEPEPEAVKPAKKKRKPRGKSQRASGMATQLNTRLTARERVRDEGVACAKCDYNGDHNIHHLETTVGYHEFQPPASGESFHPSLVPCAYIPNDGTGVPCELTADSAIHDPNGGYVDCHPYVAPATAHAASGGE
jgi:hypothetical protein